MKMVDKSLSSLIIEVLAITQALTHEKYLDLKQPCNEVHRDSNSCSRGVKARKMPSSWRKKEETDLHR